MKNPILCDIPFPIETKRLIIRAPQIGDGQLLSEAMHESYASLQPWMTWARAEPDPILSETNVRRSMARWILREDLFMVLVHKEEGLILGGSGLHRMNWDVGKFEVGYWVRTRYQAQGYIQEAASAITQFAFAQLEAKRVEIRCDANNVRSAKIPEALGFKLEGILQNDALDVKGEKLRDTKVYARINAEGLPDVEARWG